MRTYKKTGFRPFKNGLTPPAAVGQASERKGAMFLYPYPLRHSVFAVIYQSLYFIPRLYMVNAHISAASSITLLVGLPAPCPALVSIRINTGLAPL